MALAHFEEANVSQLYYQLSTELAQARTLAEGAARGLGVLEQWFTPHVCCIIWITADVPASFGLRFEAEPRPPSPQEWLLLESGDLATEASDTDGRLVYCFVPLRARGTLLGWVYMERPSCTLESQVVLRAIAAQLGPAMALLDVTATHQVHIDQLQALFEIGRTFSSELNLDTLLNTIYDGVRQLVDASHFYIALYDATSGRMDMVYSIADSERYVAPDSWNVYEGLSQVMVETRAPLCTDDYVAECRRRGIAPLLPDGTTPRHAWLGIPLIAHDRLVGLMNVSSMREGYVYTAQQVELMATIGVQAAIAIENARLYQRTERQARELATLNQIGHTLNSSLDPQRVPSLIMEQVCRLLGVEEGSLLLVDQESGELVFAYTSGNVGSQLLGQRLPNGVGIVGYVARSGKSLIVNDVQVDSRFYSDTDQATGYTTRAVLAVPLISVGGVQGVIEVLNPQHGSTFTSNDQQLLEAVADQAVVALENARAFAQVDQALARRAQELSAINQRLEHNLQSLTALNAVAMAINTALRSPDEIFAMTARGAVELTHARGASILLLGEDNHVRHVVQIGTPPPPVEVEAKVREVVASGHSQAFLHALASGESLLIVPLRALQRTLGALCMFYGDELPDSADQETIVLFATQAAGAVENTQLFDKVRDARDAMASILASTRDGVMLIGSEAQVELANGALMRLSGVAPRETMNNSIMQFLSAWKQVATYESDEWHHLRRSLSAVVSGSTVFESGQLNAVHAHQPTLEWNVLKAERSGANAGGALLVLRDITEAKAAERLRDDLTNMIVHDLRSPLSSVMAAIELLQKDVEHISATSRNVLSIAHNSSTQMLSMINTLLDISRLEDGRLPLDLAACDVTALIERAREQLSSLARERSVLVQTDVQAFSPLVCADAELIVRVVQNLLGNALKFSGRNSTVLVRAWPVERSVRSAGNAESQPAPLICVAVSDRGIGIAAKDQEKIFTKFSQVSDRRSGSGLGLTFCKLVVEAHGGAIWVESALGAGSTFFFTLPVASASA